MHEAGYTHNNVNAKSIVLDGDNVRLVGFGQSKKIGCNGKELYRQDVWAAKQKIEFKTQTPKSDMVMLTRFLLREKYITEEIIKP